MARAKKQKQKPEDVKDLKTVLSVGDEVIVRHHCGGWVLVAVEIVHKTVAHCMGVGTNVHWNITIGQWNNRLAMLSSHPAAKPHLKEINERREWEEKREKVNHIFGEEGEAMRSCLPRRSSTLDKIARGHVGNHVMGPMHPFSGAMMVDSRRPTTTIELGRLNQLVESHDRVQILNQKVDDLMYILARVRVELGDQAYKDLVDDAMKMRKL